MTCNQCGVQNPDNGAFCVGCGQPLAAPQASPLPAQPFPPYAAPEAASTADEAKDAEDNKLMGILAYLNILVLVPIFAAKESEFAKFHANQGLVLCLASYVGGFALGIVSFIMGLIRLGFIGSLLSMVFSLAVLACMVLGILSAVKGEKKELPLIGKFKILK